MDHPNDDDQNAGDEDAGQKHVRYDPEIRISTSTRKIDEEQQKDAREGGDSDHRPHEADVILI